MISKTKIKTKLENKLGRKAKKNELINAEKDTGLLVELILDEIDEIKYLLKKNNIK